MLICKSLFCKFVRAEYREAETVIGSNCTGNIFSVIILKKMASFSVSLLCSTQCFNILCSFNYRFSGLESHETVKLFRLSGDFLKVFQHLVIVQKIINCTICIQSSWFLTE